MDDIKINSIEDVERIHQNNTSIPYSCPHYRGEANCNYDLKSGIAREQCTLDELRQKEQGLYNDFVNFANKGSIPIQNFGSNNGNLQKWQTLFQAQHLGLKTRLLDWTIERKVALWFAVENEKHYDKDGRFIVYKGYYGDDNFIYDIRNNPFILNNSPFEITNGKLFMINPEFCWNNDDDNFERYLSERRRYHQSGRFSIQSLEQSLTPLNKQEYLIPNMEVYIIDKNAKRQILSELSSKYNLQRDYIYNKDMAAELESVIKSINEKYGL